MARHRVSIFYSYVTHLPSQRLVPKVKRTVCLCYYRCFGRTMNRYERRQQSGSCYRSQWSNLIRNNINAENCLLCKSKWVVFHRAPAFSSWRLTIRVVQLQAATTSIVQTINLWCSTGFHITIPDVQRYGVPNTKHALCAISVVQTRKAL